MKNRENFNKWFNDSGVIDSSGNPLVVYHGTMFDFNEFSLEFCGEGDGCADWGNGFYFSSTPLAANEYADGEGGNVMPVYLSIQNPATNEVILSNDIQDVLDDGMGFSEISEILSDMGYDGIAFTHKDGEVEYVVFNPEQIKSAIGNNGDFNPSNNDICR